jgi:nucleoside-diphosphate-sugar epimerase
VHTLARGEDPLTKVRAVRPEVTFHLATLFLAENSYDQVKPLVQSNLELGTELADALARENCLSLVTAGTAWQNYNEKGTASCLYAATKEAFESILRYYADSAGLRVCVLKLYDTYGPGDQRRKLLKLLREAARSSTAIGLSPGEQKIDLLHVSDAVAAFIKASERVRANGPGKFEEFYLRSGRMLSIRELVGVIQKIKPFEAKFGERPYLAREIMQPWTKGEILPGWTPAKSLEAGLKEYFEEADV